MRVIYCYVKAEPHSEFALRKHAPRAKMVDTSGSIYAYNDAIASYWNGKEDLVVVEQDKEITGKTLPSFAKCKKPWCTYSAYAWPSSMKVELDFGLSCAKFSAELQRIIDPKEFLYSDDPVWSKCELCNGAGCWKYLDARIAKAIRCHGIDLHCHGHIKHYHDYGILGKLCEL
jgi:hypothetical protein